MRAICVAWLAACAGTDTALVTPTAGDGPCELVQAMLSIDEPHYQRMYAATSCGDGAVRRPLIVQVIAPPSLIPESTTCPGRRFVLFKGDPSVQGTIVRLNVGASGTRWSFIASMVQPNATPMPDGGFESADYYCFVGGGVAELLHGRWRTFYEPTHITAPR